MYLKDDQQMTESKTACPATGVIAAGRLRKAATPGTEAIPRRRPSLLATMLLLPIVGCAPLAASAATAATPATPAIPATPATAAKGQAALEKQLDAARSRLKGSAREVADRTRQLHGGD